MPVHNYQFFSDRMNTLEELHYSRLWGAAMKRTFSPGFLASLLFFMIFAAANPVFSAPACDGDLTGNGTVEISDALRALRIAVQLINPTTQDMTQGDVFPFGANGKPSPDGAITIGDALLILKKTVGLFDWETRPEPSPPFVTATVPAAGGAGVARSASLLAAFNEGLDPATVTPATFYVRDAANYLVSGMVRFNGITATFVPMEYMDPLTAYTATVSGLVRDLAGNAMGSDHSWTFTTGATTSQSLLISSLSTSTAAPLSHLIITGMKFDPAATLTVKFFDYNGFKLDVPVLEATSTTVTVAVPPYVNPSTGTFGSGTVNVRVLQNSNGTISASNIIAGLQIGPLPTLTLPPGSVSANIAGFLELTLADTENRLLELDASSGGHINTANLRAQLESIRIQYGQLKGIIRNAIANPGQLEVIGQINGTPVSFDQESLRVADQWMVAEINGILAELQGVPVQQAFTSPAANLLALAQAASCTDDPGLCQSTTSLLYGMKTVDGSEAQSYQQYNQNVLPTAAARVNNILKWFGVATATVGVGVVIAGGSIPISVVALLTTATVVGGMAVFGMDASVLSANSSDKEAAKRLLDDFNSQMESVVTGVISPIVGDKSKPSGIIFDLCVGWKPILEEKIPAFVSQAKAFIDATPPPPPPPACTYSYSGWTPCQSNNTQTRTVISSTPSGCVGTPVLTQSCTYVPPLPGYAFVGPFTGSSTETIDCAQWKDDINATITSNVSGNGTLIDPYSGSMTIEGTAVVSLVYCSCEGGCDPGGSVPLSGAGIISGSQGKVQASASGEAGSAGFNAVFADGTINGNALIGTFTFNADGLDTPIVKTITLSK